MLLLNVRAVKQDLRASSLLMKEEKIWSELFKQVASQPHLYEMYTQLKNLQCLIMELLSKCSQNQNIQFGYLLCETCNYTTHTLNIK